MKVYARIIMVLSLAALTATLFAACDRTPSGSASSSSSAAQSESSPSSQAPSLDWEDDSDRELVNEGLRWMAQAFWDYDGSSVDLDSPENLVNFGVKYLAANDSSALESGDFTSISAVGGGVLETTNMRVDAARVSSITEKYLAKTPDYPNLDGQGRYDYVDGFVYFGTTGPIAQMSGYSAADSVEDLGGGRYRASFAVLESSTPYTVEGPEFYALDADGILAEVKDSSLVRSGEAVFKVSEAGGAEKAITLESYELGARLSAEEGSDAADTTAVDDPSQSIGCEAFKVDLPSDVAGSLDVTWSQDYYLVVSSGRTELFEVRAVDLAPLEHGGGEAKSRQYLIGNAVGGGVSSEVRATFPYIDPSGEGNAHWNNASATEPAVERLLGMTPEELITHISLRDASGAWVPAAPLSKSGD